LAIARQVWRPPLREPFDLRVSQIHTSTHAHTHTHTQSLSLSLARFMAQGLRFQVLVFSIEGLGFRVQSLVFRL